MPIIGSRNLAYGSTVSSCLSASDAAPSGPSGLARSAGFDNLAALVAWAACPSRLGVVRGLAAAPAEAGRVAVAPGALRHLALSLAGLGDSTDPAHIPLRHRSCRTG